jgi:hypothetical protein
MKFRIAGTLEVDIVVEMEADSAQEALDDVDMMDICIGNDTDVICTTCNVSRFTEDEYAVNLTYKKWDDQMSKEERMKFLKGECLCSDDCAFELAGREAEDLPENYIEQLDDHEVEV